MNLRGTIDWGLVEKVIVPGERKEFSLRKRNVWKVAMQIVRERKKKRWI